MPKLLRVIKNQLQRFKRKKRFDWKSFIVPGSILLSLGLIGLTIFIVSKLPPRAPNFKKNSSEFYKYEAKNKVFQSGVGIRDQKPIVSFSVSKDQNITFLYQADGKSEVNLTEKENKLTFAEIEQGIDLTYQTIATGIKEEIILKQARQKEKEPNVFTFETNFQGAYPKESVKGISTPVFFDENGKYLFHFEKPFAIDAAGNRTDSISLQIEDKTGSKIPELGRDTNSDTPYIIRLTVDEAWLKDSSRVYPITIDPTIFHDTSLEFSLGSFNRSKDNGTSSPNIESSYQELVADQNTIALWHMNETAMNTCTGGVNDICSVTGASLDAQAYNQMTPSAPGKLGASSFIMDGTGDVALTANYNMLANTTLTAEAWVYLTANNINSTTVVSHATAGGGGWSLYFANNIPGFWTSAGTNLLSPNDIPLNEWHHIAATFDSNGTKVLYVDGLEVARNYGNSYAALNAPFSIGRFYADTDNYYFIGKVDEVRVSSVVRTQEEIKSSAGRRSYSTYTSPPIDLTKVASWNPLIWNEWGVNTGDGETPKETNALVAQWNFNETSGTILNNIISGTSPAVGGNVTDKDGYRIHTFTGSGTFTVNNLANVEVLVVAGGGGGGGGTYHSGGGGGGGLVYDSNYAVTNGQTITVTVGGGGAGGVNTARGTNGQNSVFNTITAVGGGGGANSQTGAGLSGGSGGGAVYNYNTGGTPTAGQGFAGGTASGSAPNYGSGGGGGAGEAGGNGTSTTGGKGGDGLVFDISGYAKYYAGGGGGSTYSAGTPGPGGQGGGGAGSTGNATSGTANTGGGGGGAERNGTTGGSGGSGIIIVRYPYTAPAPYTAPSACGSVCNGTLTNFSTATATGGTITRSNGYVIHTFTSGGTFTPSAPMNVEVLVVGGGGGGGTAQNAAFAGGGGGGGGYRTANLSLAASPYTVTVGGGGAANVKGGDSVFSSITSTGGGAGTGTTWASANNNGGSGGGGIYTTPNAPFSTGLGNTPATSPSQGNNGGTPSNNYGAPYFGSCGGGGAGGIGLAFDSTVVGGNGGPGIASSISGFSVTYAGGGGGGVFYGGTAGSGGTGGGGAGGNVGFAGTAGTANTGGGGGGGGGGTLAGGAGGSGIVIVRYPDNIGTGWTSDNKRWGAGALAFDGVDDYVSIPDSDFLSFGNAGGDRAFSISTWVRPDSLDTAVGNWIINKRNAGAEDEYQLALSTKKIAASIFTSNANYIGQKTFASIEPGNWYHITFTYDGSETAAGIKIYVNGKLEPTFSSSSGTYTGMNNGSQPVTIGKAGWSNSLYFDGIIDSTQIYSRDLTASEILSNYQAGNMELLTRVGSSANADDGTWEDWKPLTSEALIDSFDDYSAAGCSGGTSLDNGRIYKFTSSDTFTCTTGGNVEVLVVAGGGGGGMDMGGGGGGGGVISKKSYTVVANTPITVTVGNGGAGAPAAGTGGQPVGHPYTVAASNGQNSVFGSLVAIGGGAGGSSYYAYTPGAAGSAGGSGGGASGYSDTGTRTGGAGTVGQGYAGGGGGGQYYSGGGGGAGGVGLSSTSRADGGAGFYSDILGPGYYWGGGGGGAGYSIVGGHGGNGGGGGGAIGVTYGGSGLNPGAPGGGGSTVAQANTPGGDGGANTGGGGGGGSHYRSMNNGGNGGSGIVIVRLSPTVKDTNRKIEGTGSQKLQTGSAQADSNMVGLWHLDETGGTGAYIKDSAAKTLPLATGGTITTSGAYTIHTFTKSGTFKPNGPITAEVLVVAGGGGGGSSIAGHGGGGGGGAGGLTYNASYSISSGAPLRVAVGAGGLGGSINAGQRGSNGGNSVFGTVTTYGGGGGGAGWYTSGVEAGASGGSGGGAGYYGYNYLAGTAGTAGQGYAGGGNGAPSGAGGGGGGGAGGVGWLAQNVPYLHSGGYGGAPSLYSISGTSRYYAEGGAGGGNTIVSGSWGDGGGGGSIAGVGEDGDANTGGGGGAAYAQASKGGAGGSGVVIVRYLTSSAVSVANNGTPNNTTVVNGISGKGRNFDGNNDYIDFGSDPSFDFGNNGAFTLSGWVKPTSLNDYANFVSKVISNRSSTYTFMTTFMANGRLSVYSPTSAWVDICPANSVSIGKWQHVTVDYDGTTAFGYVNGQLCGSGAFSYTDNAAHNVFIGSWSTNAPYDYNGLLDEVSISNVARSSEEIAEAYRLGRDQYINKTISSTDLSGKTSVPFYVAADRPGTYLSATAGETPFANYQTDANTLALWHLDEQSGSGYYFKDSSGNGNHALSWNSPLYSEGKIGKARYFGNSLVYNNNLTLPATLTLEAWVKPSASALNGANWHGIVGWYNNDSSNINGVWIYNNKFAVWSATGGASYTNATLSAGKWYHVALVYTSNSRKVYINGQLDYSDALGFSSPSTALYIGGLSASYPSYSDIDEVRVSNINRSVDELRQAYEVGSRSHQVTIDFAARLDSGNLITGGSDLNFTVDATYYGLKQKGDALYAGDKIIVRENYNGTEYMAQGSVASVNSTTGAVVINSWDSGSTFPTAGFTVNADVFKWQREYWDITGPLDSHLDTTTNLTLRLTNNNEGRTIWLDDFKSSGGYLSNPVGSTITSSTGNRYFQYKAIISSNDSYVSPSLSHVVVDYVSNSVPVTPILNSPTSGTGNLSLKPTLLTTATDVDGDYLRYKIELCEDLSMSVACQTFTQPSSYPQTGWTGQNAEWDGSHYTAYSSGTQASYTVQTNLTPNKTYYWRSYAIDQGGSNTWSGTQALANNFTISANPSAPTIPYTEGLANPSAVTDLTPEFSAIHNDINGDGAIYYEIEVNAAADFSGAVMWDSNKQSMSVLPSSTRSSDFSYAGATLALNGVTYYWRIRFWDAFDLISPWSEVQRFSMNAPPIVPVLDSPLTGALKTEFKPTLLTTATDVDGDYLRYKIELCEDLSMSVACQTFTQPSSYPQTGWTGQNAEWDGSHYTAYSSGTQASYAIQTNLTPNKTYYWRSYAIDQGGSNTWSGTQALANNFTTSDTPLPASTCFVRESINDSQLLIMWIDNADNEDFYEVQRRVDGGAWTTLQTGMAANTVNLLDNTISSSHIYQYRIAPYFSGLPYASWCTTSNLKLGLGLFNLQGIKASGLNFN